LPRIALSAIKEEHRSNLGIGARNGSISPTGQSEFGSPGPITRTGLLTVGKRADITPDPASFKGVNRMPIISATALKGGVGKTTLVHMLAGAFSLAKQRVLTVDNDPQASLSSGMLGAAVVEQFDPASTIAAIYAGLDPLPEQVIRPSGVAGVDLLAGSMAAAKFNLPEPYAAPMETQAVLRSFLDEVRDQYDVVLIDNPPNLQAATWAALVASDFLIVPLIPEDYGTMSLSPVLESIRLVASGPNPSVVMLGLVLTMVQPRLGVHVAFESVLRHVHGDGVFNSRVPMAADIKEAISHHLPVSLHKPRGASAKAFKLLVEELMARIGSHSMARDMEAA
jgi:chromosome partitioning protein